MVAKVPAAPRWNGGLFKCNPGLFNRKSLSPDRDADDLIEIDRSATEKASILDGIAFRFRAAQRQAHLPAAAIGEVHFCRTLYFFDGGKPALFQVQISLPLCLIGKFMAAVHLTDAVVAQNPVHPGG